MLRAVNNCIRSQARKGSEKFHHIEESWRAVGEQLHCKRMRKPTRIPAASNAASSVAPLQANAAMLKKNCASTDREGRK